MTTTGEFGSKAELADSSGLKPNSWARVALPKIEDRSGRSLFPSTRGTRRGKPREGFSGWLRVVINDDLYRGYPPALIPFRVVRVWESP